MSINKILIANRGEIATRIARTARLMDIKTVALYHQADRASRHWRYTDSKIELQTHGIHPYLDIDYIIALAKQAGCDALHPGYGFLSESAALAAAVKDAGMTFIGPPPETLALFGDKLAARGFALKQGIPVLEGQEGDLQAAEDFLGQLPSEQKLMLKARSGGGGRGMRLVSNVAELAAAWPRCQSEASKAFGSDQLYIESCLPKARHIEIQVAGDQSKRSCHLWERDCTFQRNFQKIVEIAPAPRLPPHIRDQMLEATLSMADQVEIKGLATFEFVVSEDYQSFFFIEVNPRLQVEHTVTEEVLGLDLVKIQIQLAEGLSLKEVGLDQTPTPNGYAIQARINAEKFINGQLAPSSGSVSLFEPASGPGVRVDAQAYSGCTLSTTFDSLIAKLIVHDGNDFPSAVKRMIVAIKDFRIEGVESNLPLLLEILSHPDLLSGQIDNQWIARQLEDMLHSIAASEQLGSMPDSHQADPLPVFGQSRQTLIKQASPDPDVIRSAIQGTVVALEAEPGSIVRQGAPLLIIEAMKMEHVIAAPYDGMVQLFYVQVGEAIAEGHDLALLEPALVEADSTAPVKEPVDPDAIRPDLQEMLERKALTLDENRPEKVAKREKTGHRMARQNIADICDPGTFVEYGSLVVAAQRKRRSLEDLMKNTPADGMVAGLCTINGELFSGQSSRCILMAYDYTVLAGTQGLQNHRKKDRIFELADKMLCPLVLFAEGGGGRPGDTDGIGIAGLDCLAFYLLARLSALVPLIGISTGRCFAGNAALLGCCDVTIVTEDGNVGMGGPAMIEGGGLGLFAPEDIGPAREQARNGVVDILVKDEAEAVIAAKKYLSYFQGNLSNWTCADQKLLRTAIPENRLRVYDIKSVIHTLADEGSVLELREHFSPGMVTALARFEGKPIGIIANNPLHLAGAIDANCADKSARFIQLCDAFDLPVLFLCDCPGIMVGPEAEKSALVRHAARLFLTGANLSTPFFTIILRKSYGLGAQAMAGGSFKATNFTVCWPTGELGGMGLEGAVTLGYRKELMAVKDPEERNKLWEELVQRMYKKGKAINAASVFEIDEVIDPADSRFWILAALNANISKKRSPGDKKRPYIDSW